VIYAIRAVGTEFVKFGYTKDDSPINRIRTMQVGCPHELLAVAFGPGDEAHEASIHKRLYITGAHHRGEWFTRCVEVDKIIWEIRDSGVQLGYAQEPDIDIPIPCAPGRLGRVLAYAQHLADKRDQDAERSQKTLSQSAG
jgi:hypothetical protein